MLIPIWSAVCTCLGAEVPVPTGLAIPFGLLLLALVSYILLLHWRKKKGQHGLQAWTGPASPS